MAGTGALAIEKSTEDLIGDVSVAATSSEVNPPQEKLTLHSASSKGGKTKDRPKHDLTKRNMNQKPPITIDITNNDAGARNENEKDNGALAHTHAV